MQTNFPFIILIFTNFANDFKIAIMQISKQTSKHVVYVTMSRYVASFLRYVYRADDSGVIYIPEDFPYVSSRLRQLHEELYRTITTDIVDVPLLTQNAKPNSSFSELAYHVATGKVSLQECGISPEGIGPNIIPTTTDNLVPFALPDVFKVNRCVWAKTTSTVQLTPANSAVFRRIAKLMFWHALTWHIDNIYNPVIYPTIISAIEDFMIRHCIDTIDLDTIERSYRRERTTITRIINNLFDAIDPERPNFFLNKH